jgi:uncharacterized protein (TIGR03382 family)
MKLANGEDASAVHPISLRFEGGEPCIPLRLTAIAAQEDMAIRVMVLADEPAAPQNWPLVVPNELQLDWIRLAANYDDFVTQAIDEAPVDGRGFVREFSGSSWGVSRTDLFDPIWDSTVFEDIDPTRVVYELRQQGLVEWIECDLGICAWDHPLLDALITEYLPVPNGINAEDFYGCLSCYEQDIDLTAWDSAAFAADLEARVIAPGRRADEILDGHPALTRLYTTISPHEMVADPTFHTNASLGVTGPAFTGTYEWFCDDREGFSVPASGRRVMFSSSGIWPSIDGMPFVERVEMIPNSGAPMTVQDNAETIDTLLTAWNGARGGTPEQPTLAPRAFGRPLCAGCGCAANPDGGWGSAGFAAMVLLMLQRRRARGSTPKRSR